MRPLRDSLVPRPPCLPLGEGAPKGRMRDSPVPRPAAASGFPWGKLSPQATDEGPGHFPGLAFHVIRIPSSRSRTRSISSAVISPSSMSWR